MRRALLSGLAASSAALAAWIWLELRAPAAGADVAGMPAPLLPAPAPRPQDEAGQRASDIKTILARPLFSPDRRPTEAAAPAPAPAASLPRMTAILIDGRTRSAIFAGTGGGKPVVVGERGRIGPFTIQSIEPQRVTITGPDGERTLRTSFDPHPPPASSAAPLAPAAGPPPGPTIAGAAR